MAAFQKGVLFSRSLYNPHKFIRGENARRGCFVERNDNKNNNNNNTAAVVAVVAATSSFSFWRARRGESFWNEIIIIIIINFCGTRTAREEAL